MELLTLYVGQGALAAVRAGGEAIIVDAHMPDTEEVTPEQVEDSLSVFTRKSRVVGLILTGFDRDHAPPQGVDSILTYHDPDWVMYPKCFKDTDCTSELFQVIERHERRRQNTSRPLVRHSLRLDRIESRHLEDLHLAEQFRFELFSPHIADMDSSNNSSLVLKVTGRGPAGFSYLVTGDTETERWTTINEFFGGNLRSDVMAAPHHGSLTGVNAETILNVYPNTVLISAGVDNQYDHPHPTAVQVYRSVATHVFATNCDAEGACLFTRRTGGDFDTQLVR